MGYVGMAPCISCNRPFTFNPELVPSAMVDPATKGSPDVCTCHHNVSRHQDGRCLDCSVHPHEFVPSGDPARCRWEPICEGCVRLVNLIREQRGLPLIRILPGAYDPVEEMSDER